MSQKRGNEVKPPPAPAGKEAMRAAPERSTRGTIDEQHHGENTKSLQDDKRIGQGNGAGRPPLMKK